MSKSRHLAYAALLYNAFIWGILPSVVKPILSTFSPLQLLFLRYLFAAIGSIPIFAIYYYQKHPKVSKMIKPILLELSILTFPILILYEGLSRTSALEASLIEATGPLLVVVGAAIFLKERETKRSWQGIFLALLGSIIITLEPLWNGHGFVGSGISGNLMIFLYCVVWAIYANFAKKFYKKSPPLALGMPVYAVTAFIFGYMLFSKGQLPSLAILASNPSLFWTAFYLAIPAGLIPNIFYLYAASRIEVSEANIFGYLKAVFAIPAAFLLLGEIPSITTVIAIILIAYGVYRAEIKSRKV